jgi:hypothetical protein
MFNLDAHKKHFERHIATLKKYGSIKVLDFGEPGRIHYHIRFTFLEDMHTLHISGDLGYLTAVNACNMTFKGFGDYFANNPEYFEEKVKSHSRPLYTYDVVKAKDDLKDQLAEWVPETTFDFEDPEELKEETIDEILEDYSDDYGLGNVGYNKLCEIDRDCFEWAGDLGKQRTLFIELYCMAFRLAVKDLERQGIYEV